MGISYFLLKDVLTCEILVFGDGLYIGGNDFR